MNTKSLFDLTGKTAVVTGGLGKLGQQFSRICAEYGARVVVLDIIEKPGKYIENFETLVREERIKVFQCDITARKQLEKVLQRIKAVWQPPSILINASAIDSPPDAPASENGPFENYPEASLDKILSVNVKGTFLCCQVFGGDMAAGGGGSIINIASIYGMVSPNQNIYDYKRKNGELWYKPAAYSVSKSAIYNLTRYLATYWGKKGVRVNTVSPAGVFNNQDENFLDSYLKHVPVGRMANPDEINGTIVYLASEASSYVTGANLVVDGGWTAW